MHKFAIYGKGGSGKSMIAANLSIHFARKGYKALQIGCDPKHDSTRALTAGKKIPTVVDVLQEQLEKNADRIARSNYLVEGLQGIGCIETGGPESGAGCAGLGIVSAFRLFSKHELLADYDVVVMDVLGDVVCGGFAMPLTRGLADAVLIVVSDTLMSLYAANNIAKAVRRYHRNGVYLAGLVINAPRIPRRAERIALFAGKLGTNVLATIPFDERVLEAESKSLPVSELHANSDIDNAFAALGQILLDGDAGQASPPTPLGEQEWEAFVQEFVK